MLNEDISRVGLQLAGLVCKQRIDDPLEYEMTEPPLPSPYLHNHFAVAELVRRLQEKIVLRNAEDWEYVLGVFPSGLLWETNIGTGESVLYIFSYQELTAAEVAFRAKYKTNLPVQHSSWPTLARLQEKAA